jgi:hypothetical protein
VNPAEMPEELELGPGRFYRFDPDELALMNRILKTLGRADLDRLVKLFGELINVGSKS